MKPSAYGSRRARAVLLLSPCLLLALAGAVGFHTASAAAPLASAAPPAGRVALPGSVHPKIKLAKDIGRMDPARRFDGMSVTFKPSAATKAKIAQTLATLSDPTSPSYHRWLTPEDYASRFGAGAADIARVSSWLASQGLDVQGTSRIGTRVSFGGTVAQIERAFQTEMHRYDLDGVEHFAMSAAPSVPADMAGFVLGIHGLHDFHPHAAPHPNVKVPVPTQDGGTVDYPSLGPADFATIYDVAPLYAAGFTGAGQRVAVAEETDFNDADIAFFRTTYFPKLAANPPKRVLVPNSGDAQVLDQDDLGEAELDPEWAGAVAQEAEVDYVFTGNGGNLSVYDAFFYAIEQDTAPVISVSYGAGCETSVPASEASQYEVYGDAASLMGITAVIASGDTGAAGCDPNIPGRKAAKRGEYVGLPASVPSLVAVGGTQFDLTKANLSTYLDTNDDAKGYIPESGWDEIAVDTEAGAPDLYAGTGGVSTLFPKPYWQVPNTPNDKFRDVPDVALSASVDIMPYAVAYSWTAADGDAGTPTPEGLTAVGGTSAAAPSFASILTLVNQALLKKNSSVPVGLGNANPVLYALAYNPVGKDGFHDITTGNNIVPCTAGSTSCPTTPPLQYGYECGPGYDLVTGIGSIDADKLVTAWVSLTPTSTTLKVNASGTTEGSSVQLTATVASTATANALTGDVVFYFKTLDQQGNIDESSTLGTVAIVPTTSGDEGGTATLTTTIPGGLTGSAQVVAFYGGDKDYLASWSTVTPVSSTSTLAICPTAVTLAPSTTGLVFKTTGGVPPVSFTIGNDDTCGPSATGRGLTCSSFDDAGVFTAGPEQGTAQVIAIDSDNAEVVATVTVDPDAGAGVPAVCGADAGAPGDAGPTDASVSDATTGPVGDGGTSPGGGKNGCSCEAAGSGGFAGAGAGWSLALVGLVALRARRRRQS